MTYSFFVSNKPSTGTIAVFNLKTQLKSVGWTVKNSSDATTYNSTGDQITSGTSGANGLGNTNAWFRIQQPTSPFREFIFQRGSSDVAWRVKYSGTSKFTGGSPAATQVPSATDEQLLLGGGTDAAPTFATWFTTNNTYTQHICIGNGNSDDGYSFYNICIFNGGGSATSTSITNALLLDVLDTGSVHPDDTDPAILYITTGGSGSSISTNMNGETSTITENAKGWLKKGLAGEGFVTIPAIKFGSGSASICIPSNSRVNIYNSKENVIPVFYMRRTALTAPAGYKGVSRLIKWGAQAHSFCDVISVSTTKDRIFFGEMSFPWNGTTPRI
jgi:hypothetical protein